ncbi:SOS response-associated peptidase [Roseivirga sp. E12]|uniref:SOS response-associated peptidase n=1 Tax=Roseivirga sp. E12 TaxID=2819237 RepID=UPI001ABC58DC|nr:SOS response-associated peptidase [Roseivirga sp. E12]MBO3696862.1 SOS response-associated peptidase [Roseivirga sp. E12]
MQINYSIAAQGSVIAEHFQTEVADDYIPTFNAQPSDVLPVITSENPEHLSHFYWGINPSFSKSRGVSDKLLYAPVENILTKPSLKKSLQMQRCVIVADSFYSWKEIAKKERVPYRFHLENNAVFAIAGLWDSFETEAGDTVHTFMMITTPASSEVIKVSERMPAILNDDLLLEWLNESNTSESIHDFIKPYSEEHIFQHTINPKLSDPNFNNKALWEKVPPANQFGNLTLFN